MTPVLNFFEEITAFDLIGGDGEVLAFKRGVIKLIERAQDHGVIIKIKHHIGKLGNQIHQKPHESIRRIKVFEIEGIAQLFREKGGCNR
jgi:hypothetical protein